MKAKLGDTLRHEHQESTLEGLDDETQIKVKTAFLMFQLEHELFHIKAKDTIAPPTWMAALNEEQHQQVIIYMTTLSLDEANTDVLTWYKKEQRFRVERNFHPHPAATR
jgi:hypothetical protein